jgi:hydrogenase nickel incorporation protein HypA/HybF
MHEASLMKGLMQKIGEVAANEGASGVVAVEVWLGALSHMSAAHFAEHFAQASAGTMAERARLDVTVSEDTAHPNAQDILLVSVEVQA